MSNWNRAYNAPETIQDEAYQARLEAHLAVYGDEIPKAYQAITDTRNALRAAGTTNTPEGVAAVQAKVDYYHSIKFQG